MNPRGDGHPAVARQHTGDGSDDEDDLDGDYRPGVELRLRTGPASRVAHAGIRCDMCLELPIVGVRYKCLTCPDFDLCGRCHATALHPHPFRALAFPSSPGSLPDVLPPPAPAAFDPVPPSFSNSLPLPPAPR